MTSPQPEEGLSPGNDELAEPDDGLRPLATRLARSNWKDGHQGRQQNDRVKERRGDADGGDVTEIIERADVAEIQGEQADAGRQTG